jgi:hypothetical protein
MDRYQQHGMSPLTQEQKPAAKVVNDNTPQTRKSQIIWISQRSCVSKLIKNWLEVGHLRSLC